MKSKEVTNTERRPRSFPIDLPWKKALENQLASISQEIQRLERATSSLPYVNDDGESECPFAENLWAQKEELQEKVSGKLGVLSNHLMQLDAKRLSCIKELGKIQEDYEKLNIKETSDHYAEAVLRLTDDCRLFEEMKDAVTAVLVRARAVLKRSEGRKFPGRKPQQFSFPVGPSGPSSAHSPSPGSSSKPGGLGNEVTGLMSLGPLGQTEKNR